VGTRLKILYIIDSLGTGGAERDLAEALPCAVRHGITPVVAALRRRTEGVQADVLRMGFDVRFIESRTLLARVAAIRRIVLSERPDLIHTVLFHSDLVGRLAAWGTGVKVLTSLVTTREHERAAGAAIHPVRARVARAVDRWTVRHLTAHVHANSQAVRAVAVDDLGVPPSRITVIEGGRDPGRLGRWSQERCRAARASLGLNDRDEVLVNVGRHHESKGQPFLLEAVGALAGRRPFLKLLVVGRPGESSSDLHAIRDRLRLGERVRFLGHRDDVPDLLAAASVFVFPSLYEGLPGAVIEAMALGVPIVSSDIAPVREMLEDGVSALLVEPRSASALADAIECALDRPDLARRLGRRARQVFEERFTLERSFGRRLALYRMLCAEP
jgi:glycosyltransferase involved in cell wall biosynthesis